MGIYRTLLRFFTWLEKQLGGVIIRLAELDSPDGPAAHLAPHHPENLISE